MSDATYPHQVPGGMVCVQQAYADRRSKSVVKLSLTRSTVNTSEHAFMLRFAQLWAQFAHGRGRTPIGRIAKFGSPSSSRPACHSSRSDRAHPVRGGGGRWRPTFQPGCLAKLPLKLTSARVRSE